VIPDAAVEAAARAYYEASLSPMEDDGEGPIYTPMSWERMDGAYRNATYVFPMRLALEAAAPHMLPDLAAIVGEAWDDGNCVGLDGWVGPARGEPVDRDALSYRERAIRKYAK